MGLLRKIGDYTIHKKLLDWNLKFSQFVSLYLTEVDFQDTVQDFTM